MAGEQKLNGERTGKPPGRGKSTSGSFRPEARESKNAVERKCGEEGGVGEGSWATQPTRGM